MSLPYAYCVQQGELIDIIEAHHLYFAQAKPRPDLVFQCPNEACRELETPARVQGVNYKKLPGIDRFVRKPHYRLDADYEHEENCCWVDLKQAIEELDEEPNAKRTSNLKRSELIDVFDPASQDKGLSSTIDRAQIAEIGRLPTKRARIEAYKAYLRDNPNRTSRLHEVVHCYEAMTPEERKSRELRIGDLASRPYCKYFAPAKYCAPDAYYPRIYFGLANVRKWRTGYSIRFQETARQTDDTNCTVTVFVPNEMVDAFRGRGALLATLEVAQERRGDVVTCYVFGRVERTEHDGHHRIDVRIESLHSLAVTLTDEA